MPKDDTPSTSTPHGSRTVARSIHRSRPDSDLSDNVCRCMRRTAAIVLFSAIVILSFDFTVARIPFVNRDRLRALFERQADTSWYPEYPAFLEDVRAHTQPGDSIALFVPA